MYYSITLVLNSWVLLMYTDTVKELPGYPVQNSPSGSFLSWGGPAGRGGIVPIWYCVNGMPQKETLDNVAYTCILSYPIVVSHLSFNFLCLLLLYSIYLSGSPDDSTLKERLWKRSITWQLRSRQSPQSQIVSSLRSPCQLDDRLYKKMSLNITKLKIAIKIF